MTDLRESAAVDVRPDADVLPLSRAAQRQCSRPGCTVPASATLSFAYVQRHVWIEPLHAANEPQAYDLCARHASRTSPPHGWQLKDRRSVEDRAPDSPLAAPASLDSDRTVALLAAALRAVPDVVPENDIGAPQPSSNALPGTGVSAAAATQPELVAAAAIDAEHPRSAAETDNFAIESRDEPPRPRPPLAVRDPLR